MTNQRRLLISRACDEWWAKLPLNIRAYLTMALVELGTPNGDTGRFTKADANKWDRAWLAHAQEKTLESLEWQTNPEAQIMALCQLAGLCMLETLMPAE